MYLKYVGCIVVPFTGKTTKYLLHDRRAANSAVEDISLLQIVIAHRQRKFHLIGGFDTAWPHYYKQNAPPDEGQSSSDEAPPGSYILILTVSHLTTNKMQKSDWQFYSLCNVKDMTSRRIIPYVTEAMVVTRRLRCALRSYMHLAKGSHKAPRKHPNNRQAYRIWQPNMKTFPYNCSPKW